MLVSVISVFVTLAATALGAPQTGYAYPPAEVDYALTPEEANLEEQFLLPSESETPIVFPDTIVPEESSLSQDESQDLSPSDIDDSHHPHHHDDSHSGDDHHHHHHDHDHHHLGLEWLREAVPGEPGVDYPIYWQVPRTAFDCRSRHEGYYADMETGCQVFHVCNRRGDRTFLCPNGTIFNQEHFTCQWWFNVDCFQAEIYYRLNANIGVVAQETNSIVSSKGVTPSQREGSIDEEVYDPVKQVRTDIQDQVLQRETVENGDTQGALPLETTKLTEVRGQEENLIINEILLENQSENSVLPISEENLVGDIKEDTDIVHEEPSKIIPILEEFSPDPLEEEAIVTEVPLGYSQVQDSFEYNPKQGEYENSLVPENDFVPIQQQAEEIIFVQDFGNANEEPQHSSLLPTELGSVTLLPQDENDLATEITIQQNTDLVHEKQDTDQALQQAETSSASEHDITTVQETASAPGEEQSSFLPVPESNIVPQYQEELYGSLPQDVDSLPIHQENKVITVEQGDTLVFPQVEIGTLLEQGIGSQVQHEETDTVYEQDFLPVPESSIIPQYQEEHYDPLPQDVDSLPIHQENKVITVEQGGTFVFPQVEIGTLLEQEIGSQVQHEETDTVYEQDFLPVPESSIIPQYQEEQYDPLPQDVDSLPIHQENEVVTYEQGDTLVFPQVEIGTLLEQEIGSQVQHEETDTVYKQDFLPVPESSIIPQYQEEQYDPLPQDVDSLPIHQENEVVTYEQGDALVFPQVEIGTFLEQGIGSQVQQDETDPIYEQDFTQTQESEMLPNQQPNLAVLQYESNAQEIIPEAIPQYSDPSTQTETLSPEVQINIMPTPIDETNIIPVKPELDSTTQEEMVATLPVQENDFITVIPEVDNVKDENELTIFEHKSDLLPLEGDFAQQDVTYIKDSEFPINQETTNSEFADEETTPLSNEETPSSLPNQQSNDNVSQPQGFKFLQPEDSVPPTDEEANVWIQIRDDLLTEQEVLIPTEERYEPIYPQQVDEVMFDDNVDSGVVQNLPEYLGDDQLNQFTPNQQSFDSPHQQENDVANFQQETDFLIHSGDDRPAEDDLLLAVHDINKNTNEQQVGLYPEVEKTSTIIEPQNDEPNSFLVENFISQDVDHTTGKKEPDSSFVPVQEDIEYSTIPHEFSDNLHEEQENVPVQHAPDVSIMENEPLDVPVQGEAYHNDFVLIEEHAKISPDVPSVFPPFIPEVAPEADSTFGVPSAAVPEISVLYGVPLIHSPQPIDQEKISIEAEPPLGVSQGSVSEGDLILPGVAQVRFDHETSHVLAESQEYPLAPVSLEPEDKIIPAQFQGEPPKLVPLINQEDVLGVVSQDHEDELIPVHHENELESPFPIIPQLQQISDNFEIVSKTSVTEELEQTTEASEQNTESLFSYINFPEEPVTNERIPISAGYDNFDDTTLIPDLAEESTLANFDESEASITEENSLLREGEDEDNFVTETVLIGNTGSDIADISSASFTSNDKTPDINVISVVHEKESPLETSSKRENEIEDVTETNPEDSLSEFDVTTLPSLIDDGIEIQSIFVSKTGAIDISNNTLNVTQDKEALLPITVDDLKEPVTVVPSLEGETRSSEYDDPIISLIYKGSTTQDENEKESYVAHDDNQESTSEISRIEEIEESTTFPIAGDADPLPLEDAYETTNSPDKQDFVTYPFNIEKEEETRVVDIVEEDLATFPPRIDLDQLFGIPLHERPKARNEIPLFGVFGAPEAPAATLYETPRKPQTLYGAPSLPLPNPPAEHYLPPI